MNLNSVRVCLLLLTLLVIAVPASPRLAAEQAPREADSPLADKLRSLWDGYRSAIAMAEIEYQQTLFSGASSGLDFEAFLEQLDEVDFSDPENLVEAVIRRFNGDLIEAQAEVAPEQGLPLWDERTLLIRGREVRSISPRQDHLLVDDMHLVVDRDGNRVKSYSRGHSPFGFEDLGWFRRIPDRSVLENRSTLIETDGEVQIDSIAPPDEPGSSVRLSPDDGLPRRWKLVDSSSGDPIRFMVFEHYAVFPGGVLLPVVRMQADFRRRKLAEIRMTVIRDARFDVDLEDARFVISMPAGSGWFDLRGEDSDEGVFARDVPDTAAFFEARATRRVKLPAQAGRGVLDRLSILLIVSGVLLFVIGLSLLRRGSRAES